MYCAVLDCISSNVVKLGNVWMWNLKEFLEGQEESERKNGKEKEETRVKEGTIDIADIAENFSNQYCVNFRSDLLEKVNYVKRIGSEIQSEVFQWAHITIYINSWRWLRMSCCGLKFILQSTSLAISLDMIY